MRHTVWKKAVIVVGWLLIWHIFALCVDNPILLASPMQAATALVQLVGKLSFGKTVLGSLARIGIGFLFGMAAALVTAALAARFQPVEEMLSPFVTLLKAIPVASFVVILLVWWGSSFLAAAICFLVVFPNIYISTLEGLKSADPKLLEMAAIFRLPYKNRFFYIYRPALKPFLLSSMKLALGMCWKSGVAAEVIGTPSYSIGERLYLSKVSLDTAGIFAWTAVVIVLSVCFEKIMLRLADLFFVWEPSCHAADGKKQDSDRPELVCSNLSKAYQDQQVIRDHSAVYAPGQIYYLMDPSGSGKTTLLRLLSGLEKADRGTVSEGLRFSFVFQEDRLCEEYSAVRNLELVKGKRARSESGDWENALNRLLPRDCLQKPCSQLSGGMKRRVALVRAMETDSDCVLLDEPFTGMDTDTKNRAMDYIRDRQDGRIIVIATHQ